MPRWWRRCMTHRAIRRQGISWRGFVAARPTSLGRIADPSPWSAESPNLYRVVFSLRKKGRELDQLTQRFGFRTIEVRRERRRVSQRPQDLAQGHQPPLVSPSHRAHAHARGKLRRRAADQIREHERGAHVALPTRPGISSKPPTNSGSTCWTNWPAGRVHTTRPRARDSSDRSCAAT